MTIYDKFKLVSKVGPRHKGEIGLEIETETKRPYEIPLFSYWTTHQDGSLRDFGIEYVLKQPVLYENELGLALDEWQEKTKGIKFIPDSVTTSVHVHLNFLNRSFVELGNFLTTYALIENLLIRYSGDDRRSNLFCLPICDAEETYLNIKEMFKNYVSKNYSFRIGEGQAKYAACNISTLSTLGSIELRSFRGATNISKIRDWIDILYDIYKFAQIENLDPKGIMTAWKDKEIKLLNDIFSDKSLKELKSTSANIKELVEPNVWYAASIAYSVKGNWKELDHEIKIPEFKPSEAHLDQTASIKFNTRWNDITEEQKDWLIREMKIQYERDYLRNLSAKISSKNSGMTLGTLAQRIA